MHERIKELYEKKTPINEIARRMKMTRGQISGIIWREVKGNHYVSDLLPKATRQCQLCGEETKIGHVFCVLCEEQNYRRYANGLRYM